MNELSPQNELSGKEAYEMRKAERRGKRAPSGGSDPARTRRIKKWSLGVAVVAIVGYLVFLIARSMIPAGEDMSRAIPIQGDNHIPVGATHEPYTSNPPTSGPHYAEPARPGFREGETIADEHLIHSLEHGLIWISYRPDVLPEVAEALKQFDNGLTVITERSANDADIAVAAWGRLDSFDVGDTLSEADRVRIRDFLKRYTNRGPERIPAGQRHGGV
ncbi:DUF3105 domain-containing protein [Candidatus Wolfebacteria bacterium]|nr:DUF3105 domain-containing protein [Candidatus Wolfebacteria bacterium]